MPWPRATTGSERVQGASTGASPPVEAPCMDTPRILVEAC